MEAGIGFFKIEIAERADETARRAHGAGNLCFFACRFPGNPHGSGIELCHAVLEAVMVEFEAARAEGIRLDDGRTGFDICAVDTKDDFRMLDVHELGAAAWCEPAGLQHGAHSTVKDMDHGNAPYCSFSFAAYICIIL